MKTCKKSGTIDRKTIEKNRRIQMKALCFKLVSLITPKSTIVHQKHSSSNKDICGQVDDATDYIQELTKRIDEMKRKKQDLIQGGEQEIISTNGSTSRGSSSSTCRLTDGNFSGANLPILEVRDLETAMEVVVVTGLNKNFMLFEPIHSQVRCCRVGVDTTAIGERLKKLVYA